MSAIQAAIRKPDASTLQIYSKNFVGLSFARETHLILKNSKTPPKMPSEWEFILYPGPLFNEARSFSFSPEFFDTKKVVALNFFCDNETEL